MVAGVWSAPEASWLWRMSGSMCIGDVRIPQGMLGDVQLPWGPYGDFPA